MCRRQVQYAKFYDVDRAVIIFWWTVRHCHSLWAIRLCGEIHLVHHLWHYVSAGPHITHRYVVRWCLRSEFALVKSVANYGAFHGCIASGLGCNVQTCCGHFALRKSSLLGIMPLLRLSNMLSTHSKQSFCAKTFSCALATIELLGLRRRLLSVSDFCLVLMICYNVFWTFARNWYDAFVLISLYFPIFAWLCLRIDDDNTWRTRLLRVSCKQELRQMLSLQQNPATIERRKSVFVGDVGTNPSQLRSELMIQQRIFDRLEYKEKRLQVLNFCRLLITKTNYFFDVRWDKLLKCK